MFILHFTSQESYIWTSSPLSYSPTCVYGVISLLSIVLVLQNMSFLSQLQSRLVPEYKEKGRWKSRDSGRLVYSAGSHLLWMMDNGERERERVIYKSRERVKFSQLLLKVSTRIFAACQCVEVKPRGWTWNSWGPHETWRTPRSASPFLFGHLHFTPTAPFSAQHPCSPTLLCLTFIYPQK